MRNLSIRWRLTIAYGVIMTALLAGLAFFLYRQQESYLVDNAASQLRSQAFVGLANLPDGDPLVDLRATSSLLAPALNGPDTTATLVNTEGRTLFRVTTLGGDPIELNSETYDRAAEGRVLQRTSDAGDGRSVSVILPVRGEDGGVVGLLQVDSSLSSVDESLGRLQLLLTVGVVVAHVAGLALIFAVTSWSLHPLDRVIDVCRAIARGDYGRRRTLPKGSDELGELGRAFDAMIDEVQATVGQRERSEQLTRQFAADASHELKSPLTVISGYIEVLLRSEGGDRQELKRALTGMHRETDRMSRLIADLLSLAQLEAGSRRMRREEMELAELLNDIYDESRLRTKEREFELRVDGGACVKADEEALRQALRNLVDNAVRHTAAGGVITFELAHDASNAIVRVVDSGAGIDPRHLPHVFERFYRAEGSRSRASGEAGLGLAITRALIEANGGSISAENREGMGACFTIRLPLAPESGPRSQ